MSVKTYLDRLEKRNDSTARPYVILSQQDGGNYLEGSTGKVWTVDDVRAADATHRIVIIAWAEQPDLLGKGSRVMTWDDNDD